MRSPSALVVDDDPHFRESLELLVRREGFITRSASSLDEAKEQLRSNPVDVLLMDLSLPDGDGLAWSRNEEVASSAEVIVITGSKSVETAVNALRGGALDYLTKPIDRARLTTALMNVARTRALKQEVGNLRGELRDLGRFGRMVGRSKPMLDVYDLISRVAPTEANVLIVGESGTGKELVAETIHLASGRRGELLLPVNCGAVSPNLIESELFGHERGSFTGADRLRRGYFERASGGTLFLDEITEMPGELQVKLLRVLETGTVTRVGGNDAIEIDVRVIAATNRDPEAAVKSGQLREDLYYRLNVFPILLPPLRTRGDDIALLADCFLDEINREAGARKRWSKTAMERLQQNAWTGNVRELRNVIQRAFILGDEEIGPEAVPATVASGESAGPASRSEIRLTVGASVAEMEKRLIMATLELTGGDKRRAAEMLDVSLKTLYTRLNVYAASGAPASHDVLGRSSPGGPSA